MLPSENMLAINAFDQFDFIGLSGTMANFGICRTYLGVLDPKLT